MAWYGRGRTSGRSLPRLLAAPRDKAVYLRPDSLIRTPTVFEATLSSRFPVADFISRSPSVFEPTIATAPAVTLTHSLHIESVAGNRTGATFTDNTEWDGITKFGLVFWVKNDAASGTQWVVGKNTSGTGWRLGFVTAGEDIAFGNPSGTRSLTDNLFVNGSWNLLVFSYDGTQGTSNNRTEAWCNGTQFTTKSGSCATSIAANSVNLTIGGPGAGTTIPDYHICHLAVFLGTTISGAEAAEFWNGGTPLDFSTTSKGTPTHYYQLQNDLTDSGSNPINGTGVNSPSFTSDVPP